MKFLVKWMAPANKHSILLLIQIRIQIQDFLPLQDNGSCKNFASTSINNDYIA